MTWMQTHREWGNGRVLRGVAHFFVLPDRALCGYRPHVNTEMVPLEPDSDVRSCVTCLMRAEPYE